MTSSNNNSHKVRTRTWISVGLAISIFLSLGYLFVEVSRQSAEFGEVKANLDRYTSDLEIKESEFIRVSKLASDEAARLSVTQQTLLVDEGRLKEVKANLSLESVGLKSVQDSVTANQKLNADLLVKNETLNAQNVQLGQRLEKFIDLESQIQDATEKIDVARQTLADKDAALARLNEDISNKQGEKSNLEEQIGSLKGKKQTLRNIESDINQANQRADAAEQRLQEAQQTLDQTVPELLSVQADLERDTQRLQSINEQILSKSARSNDLTSQNDELLSRSTQLEQRADAAEQRLQEAQQTLDQTVPELEKVEADLALLKQKIAISDAQLDDLLVQIQQKQQELNK